MKVEDGRFGNFDRMRKRNCFVEGEISDSGGRDPDYHSALGREDIAGRVQVREHLRRLRQLRVDAVIDRPVGRQKLSRPIDYVDKTCRYREARVACSSRVRVVDSPGR